MSKSIRLILMTIFLAGAHILMGFQAANAWTDYTAEELKQLIDSGRPIFLLNSLSEIEFNEGHIPGSVNIPVEELMQTKELPKDKDILVVTYCLGPKWVIYKEAAGLVANRLYKNVATFSGGLPAWKKAGYQLETGFALPKTEVRAIEPDQFQELVGQVCIVDIRTPKLYGGVDTRRKFGPNAGRLTMAYRKKYLLKIPMYRLIKDFIKIPKDRMVLVMDHRGKQSLTGARFLLNNGFKKVCFLKGGIMSVPD